MREQDALVDFHLLLVLLVQEIADWSLQVIRLFDLRKGRSAAAAQEAPPKKHAHKRAKRTKKKKKSTGGERKRNKKSAPPLPALASF